MTSYDIQAIWNVMGLIQSIRWEGDFLISILIYGKSWVKEDL